MSVNLNFLKKDGTIGQEALLYITNCTDDAEIPASPPRYSLLHMPQDPLCSIFRYLPFKDIFATFRVCKYLNQAMRMALKNEVLWQEVYQRDFRTYSDQNLSIGCLQACKDAYTSRVNFLKGVYSLAVFNTEVPKIRSHVIFDEKLYIGSGESSRVNVFDIKKVKRLDSFLGHQGCVNSITINDKRLYSGSSDKTIKIWDLETRECLDTLQGHGADILSLALDVENGKLYSGSADHTIKIWDLKTGKNLNTLYGHESTVNSVIFSRERLYSGAAEGTIKIWDLEKKRCLKTLRGHEMSVTSLAVSDRMLFSGSMDKTIMIWDLRTKACLHTLEGHENYVRSLVIYDRKLCSSSQDKLIKIWDIETGECLRTLKAHEGPVSSLTVSNGKIYSAGSLDKAVMTWDFTTEHPLVFKEIAFLFRSGNVDAIEEAMERFSRMPEKAKNEIYEKLYFILAPFPNDYHGCAQDAFLGENEQNATSEQKAEAIENYLSSLDEA